MNDAFDTVFRAFTEAAIKGGTERDAALTRAAELEKERDHLLAIIGGFQTEAIEADTERRAAVHRAETAEAQRDDLRALVQGENGLNSRALKIMQLKMEVRRLENENDELRAQVTGLEAVQAWRPMTEKPELGQECIVITHAEYADYGPGHFVIDASAPGVNRFTSTLWHGAILRWRPRTDATEGK